MKRLAAVAAIIALAAGPASAEPRPYKLDPEHTSVAMQISHIGYHNLLGLFLQNDGSLTFDEATGTISNLKVRVVTKSFFSGHTKRDDHVRSPDFLNSAEFPDMIFTGKTAEKTGEKTGVMRGDLTLLGVTKPVSLDVTLNKIGPYPYASGSGGPNYVVGISARGKLKRSDWGMSYGVGNGLVGDEVTLIIEAEWIRQ